MKQEVSRGVVAFALAFRAIGLAQTADLAVTNAHIYTVNPKQPAASAIAVRQGRIIAVGDNVSRYVGSSTSLIDAKGATVIPGLIDSHGHVRGLGDMLGEMDLRGAGSEREIVAKVREAAAHTKPGEWIQGRAWDQNLWAGKQFPDSRGISSAAPDNPVSLERVDGHALWVNRQALDIADINSGTPDPSGGKILRDAKGAPTGVLLDRAMQLVTRKIPQPTPGQIEQSLLRATQACARVGLTTVHDAGVQYADIAGYRSLIRKGQLPIHIYAMILYPNPLPDKPEIGDYLTIRSTKLVADGALGSRGAAMIEPYSDDPGNRGLLILDRATIRAAAEKALARGFQVNTHAIGDRANRAVLDAYADVLKGPNDKRFRIEHAQVVAPADFARFKQLSIVASMQATHATSSGPPTAWDHNELKARTHGRRFSISACMCRTDRIFRLRIRIRCGDSTPPSRVRSRMARHPGAGFRNRKCHAKKRCAVGLSKALTRPSKRTAKVSSNRARLPTS